MLCINKFIQKKKNAKINWYSYVNKIFFLLTRPKWKILIANNDLKNTYTDKSCFRLNVDVGLLFHSPRPKRIMIKSLQSSFL